MNRYQSQALAAAVFTLGTLVALPARLEMQPLATGGITVLAVHEPHVDSDSVSQSIEARERRHQLLARAMGAVEQATEIRLAGAPRWHSNEGKP
jgi:hypothetical protein